MSRDCTGCALWQPWWRAGVWYDSRLLTAVNIRFIAFSKKRWEWRCTEIIKYLLFICFFIATINGRHTCGKTPPIFVRGRCLGAFAGASQAEQSISVCIPHAQLCVHVEQEECWKQACSSAVALQVRVRAHSKTFPLYLCCSVTLALTPGWKWEIDSVNKKLTLPWRYFALKGQMVFCCWLCYTSPPSKEGTRVAMFSNPAVSPGTQFHQHTRVNSKCWFYAQSSYRSFQMILPHILVVCSSSLHSPSCNTGQISAVSLTLSLISVPHVFTNSSLVVVLYLPVMPLYFWQPKRQHMLCGV